MEVGRRPGRATDAGLVAVPGHGARLGLWQRHSRTADHREFWPNGVRIAGGLGSLAYRRSFRARRGPTRFPRPRHIDSESRLPRWARADRTAPYQPRPE